jgi:hypothetical protein
MSSTLKSSSTSTRLDLNNDNHSSKFCRFKRLHYLGSILVSLYSFVGVFICANCIFFTGKEQTRMMSQKRKDMICFTITPAYQFPFLLTLPLTPTPSQSYTNRPLWVRALLTSRVRKENVCTSSGCQVCFNLDRDIWVEKGKSKILISSVCDVGYLGSL